MIIVFILLLLALLIVPTRESFRGKSRPKGVWVCTRPMRNPFKDLSDHAYLWDDNASGYKACQTSSRGKPSRYRHEWGPDRDQCMWLGPLTRAQHKSVMGCCDATANDGTFLPLVNDCYTTIKKCVRSATGRSLKLLRRVPIWERFLKKHQT